MSDWFNPEERQTRSVAYDTREIRVHAEFGAKLPLVEAQCNPLDAEAPTYLPLVYNEELWGPGTFNPARLMDATGTIGATYHITNFYGNYFLSWHFVHLFRAWRMEGVNNNPLWWFLILISAFFTPFVMLKNYLIDMAYFDRNGLKWIAAIVLSFFALVWYNDYTQQQTLIIQTQAMQQLKDDRAKALIEEYGAAQFGEIRKLQAQVESQQAQAQRHTKQLTDIIDMQTQALKDQQDQLEALRARIDKRKRG